MPRKDKLLATASASTSARGTPVPAESEPSDDRYLDQDQELTSSDSPGVIVLHPGSSTLRLGLSTQLSPHYIPHYIAYRGVLGQDSDQASSNPTPQGFLLRHKAELTQELQSQRETGLESIRDSVAEARAENGVYDAESDVTQYAILNAAILPEECGPDDEVSFQVADLGTKPQFVIGNEALRLPPSSGYQLFKPFSLGKLNTSSSLSRSSVLSQLEDLWRRAIEEKLDIPGKDFKFYRMVVLAPDMLDREFYRDIMDLVLCHLGFDAALIHQESVCATYGAGLSSACVIDVGEEKTHICCVEDGMSNANTRVTLYYGGNDITRFFYHLLKKINFPYKECAEDSLLDSQFIQELKEKYCHFDMTVWGVADEMMLVPHVGLKGVKYRLHFADELVYAPMGIFYPSTFCLPDDQVLMEGQSPPIVLQEDVFDEVHWAAEQSKGTSSLVDKDDQQAAGSQHTEPLTEASRRLQSIQAGRILALDQAVHFSIDCTSSPDMKQKLYSSILLIGGGMAYPGAATILQNRLESSLPLTLSKETDAVVVSSNPRDMDPSEVAWKGGAVLAKLDSCQELWIENQDWELFGVRLLREKAPFIW